MHEIPQPSPSDSRPPRTGIWRCWRWLVAFLSILLVGIVLLARSGLWRTSPIPEKGDPFPLTAISSSPHLNTRPEVGYVGSEVCRSCHEDRHRSFRHTGMGRSMAAVDLEREPPDASFDHPPSRRRYQVRRKDRQLWHRELLLTDDRSEVVLAEYPLAYVVGSGRHSLTYVVEVEGFLVESPVTWDRSRKAWGMSPGYDNADQIGFERAVGDGCLVCHAGRAEALEGSLHRMRIIEPAIACERCHGPGALHAERHEGRKPPVDRTGVPIDYTIVNPAHLSRELAEAICQQCHLRSNATIVARGRTPNDFRPGLPLEDFRQDYGLEVPGTSMTVVGHVEQMHLSRCYQRTRTLTCLTCHDPHNEPDEEKRVGYYRSICLNCHEPQSCKVDARVRQKERPDNSCIHCHMPTAPTEIPHLAFTHHRIGRHDRGQEAKEPTPLSGRGTLQPFLPLARLSDIDRRRSLGLAHLETANREREPSEQARHQQGALDLLVEVKQAGLRDPVVDASLARLLFDREQHGVGHLAESALAQEGLTGQDRCTALYLLADDHSQQGRHSDAQGILRQLVRLRRHPMDWLLLAKTEKALGNGDAEVEALVRVVQISPRMWRVHQHLAERYRERGDRKQAAWHQQRAVP
jgi:hypothetical protein